jgi:hypothetical protein
MKAGQLKLRRAEFRSWLSSRRDVIVGRSADERLCPLATWLFDLTGTGYEVGRNGFYWPIQETSQARRLPTWALRFVRALDYTFTGWCVTGGEALTLIEDAIVQSNRCMKSTGHHLTSLPDVNETSVCDDGTSYCVHCKRIFVCPDCRLDLALWYLAYRCSAHRSPPLQVQAGAFRQKKTASPSLPNR